jgi:hypothetical protein
MLTPSLRAALEELGLASVSALGNMGKTPEDCLSQLNFIATAFVEGKVAGEATGALLAGWDDNLDKMSVGVRRVLQANGILSDLQARAVMSSSLSSRPPTPPPATARPRPPADPRRPWKRNKTAKFEEEFKADPLLKPALMLDRESAARHQAAAKLKKILMRAGEAARLLPKLAELGDEAAEALLQVTLASGAYKTISAHVRMWHHLEWFFQHNAKRGNVLESWTLYPPSWALVVAFVTERVRCGCGPTVPDAICSSVKWMCKKLVMVEPELDDACVIALKKEAIARVSTTLKEAQPFPAYVIKFLERVACTSPYSQTYRLIAGYTLCLIYASLRFNDALHIKVSSLQLLAGALRGVCWQTKTDRKRRGTPFAVPDVSLGHQPWLLDWYEWHYQFLHPNADFWIPRFDAVGKPDFNQPGDFKRSLELLRELLAVGNLESINPEHKDSPWELQEPPFNASKYTWHSARCTVMTWAGEAGKPLQSMLVQMHSHDPRCGEKYMRNRMGVACNMVTELVADLKDKPPENPQLTMTQWLSVKH